MANPFTAKAKKPNPFTARAKSDEPKDEPKFVGIRVVAPEPKSAWAKQQAKRAVRSAIESDKQDVAVQGVKICHAREHGSWPTDGFWTIDVINGDRTFRFDNRLRAWQLEVSNDERREPAPWLLSALHQRWLKELARQDRWRGYMLRDETNKPKVDARNKFIREDPEKGRKKGKRKNASKKKGSVNRGAWKSQPASA